MKKIFFLLLLMFISFVYADTFPAFPMSLYGDIKIWTTNISAWNVKVYDGLDNELSNYVINNAWKYWAESVTDTALVLNEFSGNIIIKVVYNWITYTVTQDQINDTNRWDWCPDKTGINFVSKNCRYDITLPQPASWGWWGGGGWWSSTPELNDVADEIPSEEDAVNTWAVSTWSINTWDSKNIPVNTPAEVKKELSDAYAFAYRFWITTKSTIEEADLEWSLIRAHMAKMMSKYAVEVIWLKANTWSLCEFSDIEKQSDEMKHYIKLSCQLGIMWVWITKFNPNGVVNRAQFWTVLSRILYGDKYNNWLYYYTDHLKILHEKGIIKNTNPTLQELRGYVMLMLMRSGS